MRLRVLAATAAPTSALTLFATAAARADPVPGVGVSGEIHVPRHPPINLCRNTVDIVGLLNPAFHTPRITGG